jgi:hypothetical protein
MNSTLIENIANAVLYEGYMLYPYRPSAVKNRQRWNFGVVYPKSYSEIQKGSDSWFMQTQCLIRGEESAGVNVKVRFLQAISRQVGELPTPIAEFAGNSEPPIEIVESLAVGNRILQSWQEAVERDVTPRPFPLSELLDGPIRLIFGFPGGRELEPVRDATRRIAAFIVRTRESMNGYVEIGATKCADRTFRLTVLISNLTSLKDPGSPRREDVLLKSFLSAHTILGVTGGEFASLIDPPAEFKEFAADCKNVGTWPVLVGEENSSDAMLSSPIILYDYPQIAPESPGDLFDGTEIDEILALRILTLSDDEKREIRQTDARAREVLERTESLPAEHFMKLHGVLRGMKPCDETTGDVAREDKR